MSGSMKSALLFVISAILLIAQGIMAVAIFDDGIAALAAGCFAFVMIVGALFAKSGALTPVMRTVSSQDTAWGRIVTREDTGDRIQCTPCWGCCGGIVIMIIGFMFAEPLFEMYGDLDALMIILPTILSGIIAILAGIVFMIEYKGPYTQTVY